MEDQTKTVVVLLIVIALSILGPWLSIWAFNEIGQYLWPEKVIPFNFWTWAATILLYSFFNGKIAYERK